MNKPESKRWGAVNATDGARTFNRQPTFPCPVCATKALVRSSEVLSRQVIEIRYVCPNHDCGHTWINHNTYITTVSPPAGGIESVPFLRLRPRQQSSPPPSG
ncbi:hypothetical protein ABAC460_10085 [Asticcacaulis sp. AC460]|uniref:ogr/Delta-like zinc finger family protein n=1 Tax=Asticcacaulis sp. AC460 TaxID=1282360 RepID=UPI0003C3CD02|nr:ogr/Delta-like zinc finger family protein [Asticcacaulis sp. AC460]ESQ90106.1 hypothetical protein ABAC460_10085 [Asticcacaulis sp. AC460]